MNSPASTTASAIDEADPWVALLHDKGLRATAATKLVLSTLLASVEPLSHEELEQRVMAFDDAGSKPDRVTLYRILERLCQAGLVRKASHSDRGWKFSLAKQDEAGTFECDQCHELTPLEQDDQLSEAMQLIGNYLKAKGQEATPSFLSAHGVCAKCVT